MQDFIPQAVIIGTAASIGWALRIERKIGSLDALRETLERVENKLDRLIESRATQEGRG